MVAITLIACDGMTDLERLALAIAVQAHQGQTDKIGEPYVMHPQRVAANFQGDDVDARVVALLHDVIEDSDYTAESLIKAGVPERLVEAVEALTRPPGSRDVEAYYATVAANPLALRVKLADIRDNIDPRRLAHLDEPTRLRLLRKYGKALTHLGFTQ